MKKVYTKRNRSAFTLIELLVVIAIIGILATIITVSTSSARKQARDTKRKADLSSVSGALEMYYAQNRTYPVLPAGCSSGTCSFTWSSYLGEAVKMPNFISSWPADPDGSGDGTYGQGYVYCSNGSYYILDATLEMEETSEFTGTSACTFSGTAFRTGVYCSVSGGKNICHYRVINK